MEICIFYSWQSKHKNNCDTIIQKALDKAVKDLNTDLRGYRYFVERGGGDVVGEEDITENIDRKIRLEADIAIVDFTHNGDMPKMNEATGEWEKTMLMPNPNANNEHGKLVMALDQKQVFKVYNNAYGDLEVNLTMPFDLRQKHYPISFYCDDSKTKEERSVIINELSQSIQARIEECTQAFLDNQKVRYSPLVPIRNEYRKAMFNRSFMKTDAFAKVLAMIDAGQSFRLLGLPGLGKTRMVVEAFRGRENDVYYCDCKEQPVRDVISALEMLMTSRGNRRQTVILDNCDQNLCGIASNTIIENGYNSQLITIHFDPGERTDSGIARVILKMGDLRGAVENMVGQEKEMSQDVKEAIINLAGGFPLMASIMIENFHQGLSIVNVSKKDVFERMLGLSQQNIKDINTLKVLTAFSIFKFIGLYGLQEKQGRFIACNKIITNIHGTEEELIQLFREVHGKYQNVEILERQGNLVLMRLIPLAIYLCKEWFDRQTTDSIATLIDQIRQCPDAGTSNMLIEGLSRRISLLSDVPLAKELNEGLTDPDRSPFLTEEVVLSALGSRLFLAFSEVNPEYCAIALYKIMMKKSDEEIGAIGIARRNLAWALDHLAFDQRSFRKAMLTLARFSQVETEENLANNTTGLFVDRFAVLLPGTEVNLRARLDVLKDLSADKSYEELIKKALDSALRSGSFQRSGGSERQGVRVLKDYVPSFQEVSEYYEACLDMYLGLIRSQNDLEELAKTFVTNARGYYLHGAADFMFRGLETIAPQKGFVWEEMEDVLDYLLRYDAIKCNNYRVDAIKEWKIKLSNDDYVYTLLRLGKRINRCFDCSYEEEIRKIHESYEGMAKILVDRKLYKDSLLMSRIMRGECSHYTSYGMSLSSYSRDVGVQKELLDVLLDNVLRHYVSRDGEVLLAYFIVNVEDKVLLEQTYDTILHSEKKYLLPRIYAMKSEGEARLAQLFELLDNGDLDINDFAGYLNYRTGQDSGFKYVAGRLLDYGAIGAQVVLSHCYHFLFWEGELDKDYQAISRKCLMLVDLKGIQMDDFVYMHCMTEYLTKHYDEEMALHIQDIQESALKERYSWDHYYLGQLYRKVLKRYTELLKPRLFKMLENEEEQHPWIELMRSNNPQEKGEEDPIYSVISMDDWFEWLKDDNINNRAYVLAMMFNYANGSSVDPIYLKLLDDYWCDEVRNALSSRFHSFGWTGTGIPLYQERIALCEDYISKLSNKDAREWFKKDIDFWEQEIKKERLENAHERAIYE